MINEFIKNTIAEFNRIRIKMGKPPYTKLEFTEMLYFGRFIAKEVAMRFKKGLIEIGHKTHCLKCNGHLAAGECECGGMNIERTITNNLVDQIINEVSK